MKKQAILIAIITFVFGALISGFAVNFYYKKILVEPLRNEKAILAQTKVVILSELRLGKQETAIKRLEELLDGNIVAFSQLEMLSKSKPDFVVNNLSQVKAYREIYPPQMHGSEEIIREVLKDIKPYDPANSKNGILNNLIEKQK